MLPKICKICSSIFQITAEDIKFYEKLNVPDPVSCPDCREKQRLVFRNDRYYYQRSCDLCKKQIISIYDPVRTKNVYCHNCWWSDKWDPTKYGKEFDFSKTFAEQYGELLRETPKLAMINDNGSGSENCEYTNDLSHSKNAYMVIGSWYVQDCMYGFQINHVKDCIDNFFVNESQLAYESIFCEHLYSCQHCMQCYECTDCIFGYDLKNCKDCILCAGLRNKQYCIWNQQYTKEEFLNKKRELELDSYEKRQKYMRQFDDFIVKIPRRFANLYHCEDTTGNNLVNCKNAKECFNNRNLHDCKWMTNGDGAKDCYECWSTGGPQLCYNCITPDKSYAVAFSVQCWQSNSLYYCENCHFSNNLFGCVGIKRGKHCILNKQYTPEAFGELKMTIIEHMKKTGEWGEFFNPKISLFAYNETAAQEWHPLNSEEAVAAGFTWLNELPGSYKKATVQWQEVPDSIMDIKIDGSFGVNCIVWNGIFECVKCQRNFKILQKEFAFYKELNIPLPRLCIDCRYYFRKAQMNPRKLYDRQCMCVSSGHGHTGQCAAAFKTTYSPEREEKIFCEFCYNKEIFG